jgi:hypothetical protein
MRGKHARRRTIPAMTTNAPQLVPVPDAARGTLPAMIAVARSQLGYVETPTNRTTFGEWFGLNGQPWCAMFLSWCAWFSGLAVPRFAYTPAGAAWFKARGKWGRTPQLGAFVFYSWPGVEGGRISHVGLVVEVYGDGTFSAIEGNTSDVNERDGGAVRIKRRSTTYVAGFGYPPYIEPHPIVSKPTPTPTPPEASTVKLPTLARGSATHEQTQTVQALLNARGASPALALDGVWGDGTDAALGAVQHAHGLRVDHVVGGQTWPLLLGVAG